MQNCIKYNSTKRREAEAKLVKRLIQTWRGVPRFESCCRLKTTVVNQGYEKYKVCSVKYLTHVTYLVASYLLVRNIKTADIVMLSNKKVHHSAVHVLTI